MKNHNRARIRVTASVASKLTITEQYSRFMLLRNRSKHLDGVWTVSDPHSTMKFSYLRSRIV